MKKEYIVYVLVFAVVLSVTLLFGKKRNSPDVVDQSKEVLQIPQDFDSEKFLGDVIDLKPSWPSKLSAIELTIQFPPNYRFLPEAHSYLKLISPQGLIKEWTLESPHQILDLGQDIKAEHVSAELGLFYCREGDEGLCLSQKVLFRAVVQSDPKFQTVQLSHVVSDEKF